MTLRKSWKDTGFYLLKTCHQSIIASQDLSCLRELQLLDILSIDLNEWKWEDRRVKFMLHFWIPILLIMATFPIGNVTAFWKTKFIRNCDPVEDSDHSVRRISEKEHFRKTCAFMGRGYQICLLCVEDINNLRSERDRTESQLDNSSKLQSRISHDYFCNYQRMI